MRRGWTYASLVLGAGLGTSAWWISTEEIDPAASEPGAYYLFLWVYTGTAMILMSGLCLLAEVTLRLARRRTDRDRSAA